MLARLWWLASQKSMASKMDMVWPMATKRPTCAEVGGMFGLSQAEHCIWAPTWHSRPLPMEELSRPPSLHPWPSYLQQAAASFSELQERCTPSMIGPSEAGSCMAHERHGLSPWLTMRHGDSTLSHGMWTSSSA